MLDDRFNLVVKHNDLVSKTRFNLSLQEQKIILYLISKIKPTDVELQEYDFNIKEFCELIGVENPKGSYTKLKKTLIDLKNKSFMLEDEKTIRTVDWISKAIIVKDSGVIKIKLDEDLKPYLINLKNNFTRYELYYILNFKSQYSIRLYELMKSYEFKKSIEIDIDILQEKLQSNYTRFVDFKKYVIEIAVKEINRETDINVDVEYIKEGRAYKKIKFYIKGWNEKVGLEQLKFEI